FAVSAKRPPLFARDRHSRRRRRRAHYGEHRRHLSFWRRLAARCSHRGAFSVYPRLANPFTQEDKTLVSALAGFGAVAVANAELYGMARAQAHELHEILEISFELSSAGKLDEFMQTSV